MTTPAGRSYTSMTPPFVRRMKYPRPPVRAGDEAVQAGDEAVQGGGEWAPGCGPDWCRELSGLLEV
ncbi:hypothetical protein KC221_23880, partial [Mycobacterium tuberculosis]|nr:hypothetical protein [Mycobacterium tuberculosis]